MSHQPTFNFAFSMIIDQFNSRQVMAIENSSFFIAQCHYHSAPCIVMAVLVKPLVYKFISDICVLQTMTTKFTCECMNWLLP